MTTQDMIISVTLKISNNIKNRNITPQRILHFLNLSQEELVTDKLILDKTTNLYEYYDVDYELFSSLIDNVVLNMQGTVDDKYFLLPDNHYLMLASSELIKNNGERANVKLLKLSSHKMLSSLPYYKDNELFTNLIQFSNKIKLVVNNTSVEKINLFYIKKPSVITSGEDCKLNLMYHLAIVEKAVVNIFKSYEDPNGVQINN